MGEVIRARLTDPSLVGAQSFTDRIKQRAFFFLKRKNKVFAQNDAGLFRIQIPAGGMMDIFKTMNI